MNGNSKTTQDYTIATGAGAIIAQVTHHELTDTGIPRTFWGQIGAQLDRIKSEKPGTFDAVREILLDPAYDAINKDVNLNGERDFDADSAFFDGSGGDRSLREALHAAGWSATWSEASYYYVMQNLASGETLSYIEGDVLRGNRVNA